MPFAKLLFLLHLKTAGTYSLEEYLEHATNPGLKMYLLHALIIKGSMKGYSQLKLMV